MLFKFPLFHSYLYITGRSKEIINRGGEVISPFEIEEAVMVTAKDSVKVWNFATSLTTPFTFSSNRMSWLSLLSMISYKNVLALLLFPCLRNRV